LLVCDLSAITTASRQLETFAADCHLAEMQHDLSPLKTVILRSKF